VTFRITMATTIVKLMIWGALRHETITALGVMSMDKRDAIDSKCKDAS